jgi:hypothetical protein
MEIHKPKPWHGWREFLKEYLIIVVGVLTALGAEQVVEQLHWRHQVEQAREVLGFDLRRVMAFAGAQDAGSPCIGARLVEMDDLLDAAAASGRLPEIGRIPIPGRGAWVMRSWSALTSGQTLSHLPNRQQLSLSALSLQLSYLNALASEFSNDWLVLQSLSGPERKIDRQEIAFLRRAVIKARSDATQLRRLGTRTETFAIQTALLDRPALERAWKQGVDEAMNSRGGLAMCSPIPRVFTKQDVPNAAALAAPITQPGTAQMDEIGVHGMRLP